MDNSGKEAEAMALLAEAERKVKNSQSFFSGLFGGSSKIEEACEIYARAANLFKMAKNWSARAHSCLLRPSPTTSSLQTTTKARSLTGIPPTCPCLGDAGLATTFAHPSPPHSSANKCLLKVAGYAAQLEQYQKAIDIYEQVGTNAMDSPLLKYSAKDYFFKAALCHFCIDMLNAKLAVQRYEELFPAFSDSRECKLMKKLLEAHEEQNVDSYTESVKEYDSISRLDQWLTTMLLRIKKTIQGEEEDLR
uniref:NSF attachment protein alpha n=1 Tax=Spermophilus dauricus TaxID=99837 RepID=A0A8C9Q1U9_SPEDA